MESTVESPKRLYTVNELSEAASLPLPTIYAFIREGLIRSILFGRTHRIPAEEFERVIREGVTRPQKVGA